MSILHESFFVRLFVVTHHSAAGVTFSFQTATNPAAFYRARVALPAAD